MKNSYFTIQILLVILSIVFILLLEQFTMIDPYIQNLFYADTTKTWLITAIEHKNFYGYIFYYTIKQVLVISGILLLILWCYGLFSKQFPRKYHKALSKYLLALVAIPLLISSLKNLTNVHCPNQTTLFNGLAPYIRIFESSPIALPLGIGKGRCFPAGHATSGFLFLILFFCLQDIGKKRYRYYGLSIGLLLGWITGIYQMARGEHFFSHTVITMILAWSIALIINIFVNRFYNQET